MSKFIKVSQVLRKTKTETIINIDKIVYIDLEDKRIAFAFDQDCIWVDKESIEKMLQYLDIVC